MSRSGSASSSISTIAPASIVSRTPPAAALRGLHGSANPSTRPYYVGFSVVGFSVAGQDIGLDPHGHSKGMTGPVAYWRADDIEQTLVGLLNAGAVESHPIQDSEAANLSPR